MTLLEDLVARAQGTAPTLRPRTSTVFEPPTLVPPDDDGQPAEAPVVGPMRVEIQSPNPPVWPLTEPADAPPSSSAPPASIADRDERPRPVGGESTVERVVEKSSRPPGENRRFETTERSSIPPDPTNFATAPTLMPSPSERVEPDRPRQDDEVAPTVVGTLGPPPGLSSADVPPPRPATEIHVSIGRVEVIARRPAAAQPRPTAPVRAVPRVDLGEYLSDTAKRSRR